MNLLSTKPDKAAVLSAALLFCVDKEVLQHGSITSDELLAIRWKQLTTHFCLNTTHNALAIASLVSPMVRDSIIRRNASALSWQTRGAEWLMDEMTDCFDRIALRLVTDQSIYMSDELLDYLSCDLGFDIQHVGRLDDMGLAPVGIERATFVHPLSNISTQVGRRWYHASMIARSACIDDVSLGEHRCKLAEVMSLAHIDQMSLLRRARFSDPFYCSLIQGAFDFLERYGDM